MLLNRGSGTFAARVSYATGSHAQGSVAHDVAVGDLNRDGKPDIASANDQDATASILLNKGDGTCLNADRPGARLRELRRRRL